MTPVTIKPQAQAYLKRAGEAPDGRFISTSLSNPFAVMELIDAGYLSFEQRDEQTKGNVYRITDAGRAALEAGPVTDVSPVEHASEPPTAPPPGKAGELNAALARADKWRQGQGWETPLMGYRFRWDGDYGGWKLTSPKPGAPVFQSRSLLTWLNYLQDYQVNGIEALEPLRKAESKGAETTTLHEHFQTCAAAYTARYGHTWKWTSLTYEKGWWYANRADGNRDYMGSASRARAAIRIYLTTGQDNAAARRAGTPAPTPTQIAVSPSPAVGETQAEKPDAEPKSERWTIDEVHQLSNALIKFTHSIGEDEDLPGVLKIHLFHKKHEDAALEALRAALPTGATVTGHGPGEFYLVKTPTPAAPPSAPPAADDDASDKREQRLVTDKVITPAAGVVEYKREQRLVTPKEITPAARHPRPCMPGDHFRATCAQCGKAFTAQRRDAKTCSPTCRKAYSRRAADVQKAYNEGMLALAELERSLRKYPDLVETVAQALLTMRQDAARLLADCHAEAAAK
jgi:hypothetical protein